MASTTAAAVAAAMKMTRMKSFVKKWQSLAKVGRVHTSNYMDDAEEEDDQYNMQVSPDHYNNVTASHDDQYNCGHDRGAAVPPHTSMINSELAQLAPPPAEGFAVVFVGKALRRYTIHVRHLQHPLFKALQQRSETCGINQSLGLTIGCEVVLFEHLLWMLDSDDPAIHTDSIHELAELYMPSDGSSLLHLLQQQD